MSLYQQIMPVNHVVGTGPTPTIAMGPAIAAATSSSVSIVGTDVAGKITIVTGSSGNVQNQNLCVVKFAQPFASTPTVQLTPVGVNGSTHMQCGATLGWCINAVTDITNTAFKIFWSNTALPTSTTMTIFYKVTG